ncbi:MAG TPA: alpha/beta hydrolase domain-containing protein [Acidimicrobiia bacterium]|nr:alpha/beta hydrolase domain-containing protein [Acidimicrobiia bacterium]
MKVSGPITGGLRDHAFGAPPVDLGKYGYREAEFFVEGDATAYGPEPGSELEIDGRWRLRPSRSAPFATRILVLRPADAEGFSGNVWLSWLNVSSGFEIVDAPPGNFRDGDALVYVSAQAVGLDGFPGVEANALRGWDPERYGSLHHPGDDFSYDIFTQVVRAVGPDRGSLDVDPLDGLDVAHVFATGASQSAIRLTSYLDAVQPVEQLLDGVLLIVSFGRSARFEMPPAENGDIESTFLRHTRIRDDVGIPVLHLTTETEAESLHPVRQPDTDTFRTWEIAGAAHASATGGIPSDVIEVFVRDGLQLPQWNEDASPGASGAQPNSLRWVEVSYAARRHLVAWVSDGTLPPSLPLIEFTGDPPRIRRDKDGNAVGGIRLPALAVPVATYRGTLEGVAGQGSLFGSTEPFGPERLRALYASRDAYLRAYDESVDDGVAAGYFLADDAADIKAAAVEQAEELFGSSTSEQTGES